MSIQDLAIDIALSAAKRSEDPYKKVGCSIFNEYKRLLSIGYNGLCPGQQIDSDFWANREERRKYIIHAEINALSCISRYDNPYLLASTLLPCCNCAINIASYGIKKVFYVEEYEKDKTAYDIFKFHNIQLIKIKI